MRYLIENTLKDWEQFILNYNDGNEYTEPYNFFGGLGLPHKVVPLRFYLIADQTLEKAQVKPSVSEAAETLIEIINLIVNSLNELPRLEILLFEDIHEFIDLKYPNPVSLTEQIVVDCKATFQMILKANKSGFK